jgi:glycoprotein endo-alpha-1,2-mannosidase
MRLRVLIVIVIFLAFLIITTISLTLSIQNAHGMTTKTTTPVTKEHSPLTKELSAGQSRGATLASRVVTFYYTWYATLQHDGGFAHWNHPVLDDSGRVHDAASGDIGSTYWPNLGLYSSANVTVLDEHLRQMRQAGIGVICTTWWGAASDENMRDFPGFTDRVVPLLLERAALFDIAVCFHLEPYAGRTPTSVRENIRYIREQYGEHPGFFRIGGRPVFFVYDHYLSAPHEWATMLRSIRGTEDDAYMVALLVEQRHIEEASQSGFDALYTYFGADRFSFGSTPSNWPSISALCAARKIDFIPCVSPGYDDRRVRPWNARTTRYRDDTEFDGNAAPHVCSPSAEGRYYSRFWQAAIDVGPALVGVTSFNEWHEGTQIEPAAAAPAPYHSYTGSPDIYLSLTRQHVEAWSSQEERKKKKKRAEE